MPLLITPGQFTRRSEFYHQLAQLTAAGLGILQTLEQLKRNPPSGSFRAPIERAMEQIQKGCTFTESFQHAGQWLPAFDIALIDAGERSGRLDASFKLLADYYNDRARIARQMIGDLAYPVLLFHFAIFIVAFLQFIQSGNWLIYLLIPIPIYAIVALLIYAGQNKHGEAWRSWVESVLHRVPVLGTGRRYLALSRLSTALEALLGAGVTIVEAWELAATASGSPALRRTVLSWRPLLDAGQTPAEVIKSSSTFPELFENQYATGEISGKLEDTLNRLHKYYQEEGTRKIHIVAQLVPRLIYFGVALMVAYVVIRFYLGHIRDIQDAGTPLN